MLPHPCFLGYPQRKACQNQKRPPHPCLLRGSKEGRNATSPLHSRGSPNKAGQNQNWLSHHCLLGGPKEGANATSPLHSRGRPNKAGRNRNWLPHPCLLRGPKEGGNATSPLLSRVSRKNSKTKSEAAASPVPSKGFKRGQKCYLTPAFSGVAQQRGTKSELIVPP